MPATGHTTAAEEAAAPGLPDAESTTVLPQLRGEQPALQGWSDFARNGLLRKTGALYVTGTTRADEAPTS